MMFTQGLKKEDVYYFIMMLIKSYPNLLDNAFIVMDNYSGHNNNDVYFALKPHIPILFLPKRTPTYNAIEMLFSWLKRKLADKIRRIWYDLIVQIETLMNLITSGILMNYETNILFNMLNDLNNYSPRLS
jgi:hypothetical protein